MLRSPVPPRAFVSRLQTRVRALALLFAAGLYPFARGQQYMRPRACTARNTPRGAAAQLLFVFVLLDSKLWRHVVAEHDTAGLHRAQRSTQAAAGETETYLLVYDVRHDACIKLCFSSTVYVCWSWLHAAM